MSHFRRSPVIPVLALLALAVGAVSAADTETNINGEHEAPIIEKIQEAIRLEEDAKSILGESPDAGDRSLASGKLDEAVEKIKEAVDMIDSVQSDSGKEFQASTDADGAKAELGSEPESGEKGKPSGAIQDDRKAQKKIEKNKPASRIVKSIDKGVEHKRTAILRMQGIRPARGNSSAYMLPSTGMSREFGAGLAYTYDGRKDKKLEATFGYELNLFNGLSIKWTKDKENGGGYVALTQKGGDSSPAAGFFSVPRRFTGHLVYKADLGVFTRKESRMKESDLQNAFVSIEFDKIRVSAPLRFVNLNVRYVNGGTQVFMNDHNGSLGSSFFSGYRGGRASLSRTDTGIEGCFRPWGATSWTTIGMTTSLGNDGLGLEVGAGANGLVGKGELGIDNLYVGEYDDDYDD